MTTIEIRSSQHSYQAIIGSNLLDHVGELIARKIRGPRCAIVSDTNVAPLFADRLTKSLVSAGFHPTLITVTAGEKSKTLGQAGEICERMLAAKLDRQSFVVGLGGGMVGDLSGFVAAIFQRGVRHVQIPTTLLAMVDSSIGGKTGVNTTAGKNLIGAFHHPELVLDDVDTLKTLPRREFHQGFAEIIKHGIIADAEMFTVLQPADLGELAPLIRRNIEIKSRIMAKDEQDRTGERALLNFGHTVGHAIEQAGNYEQFLHGEAISLGMVAAAIISNKKAGLPVEQQRAIVDLLKSFELPVRLPSDFPRAKIFEALTFDKKFENGNVHFVVTSTIGTANLVSNITLKDIHEAINQL